MTTSSNPATVAAIETGLSYVFLTPDRVFKLLKPVALPFLDHRDGATRRAAVAHEFELNHAISPDVYLRLASVGQDDPEGDDELMIVMRRLADEHELTAMLSTKDRDQILHRVARRIATMHEATPPVFGPPAEAASVASIRKNWSDNVAVIERHADTVIASADIEECARRVDDFITGRAALFERRIDDGWIRAGHGDLRCEHVFVEADQIELIDCLAFDERYRVADILSDIGFLAMDLHRLAGPDAAVSLMRSWHEFTNEHHPSSLAHFYVAYRAHVRCKVACLRHEAGDPEAAAEARTFHEMALHHIRYVEPRLILVGGGPGTGKSTLAEGLARTLGAVWLRSDEVRKDLAGIAHDEHAFSEPGTGIYSAEMSNNVTAELVRQTQLLLRHGQSVVVDATWSSSADRATMRAAAQACTAHIDEFRCVTSSAVAKERIARRMASIHNPSDATPELVDHMAERFDLWPEAQQVDTAHSVRETLASVFESICHRTAITQTTSAHRFFIDVPVVRHEGQIWMVHEGPGPVIFESDEGTSGPTKTAPTT